MLYLGKKQARLTFSPVSSKRPGDLEISREIDLLDADAKKGQQLSQNYEAKLQTFASEVDKSQSNLSSKVQQISQQVTSFAVSQAYPRLGQKTYITLNSEPWPGKKAKRPGEKWVDIVISNTGLTSYTSKDIDMLADRFKDDGWTVFVGLIGTGGAMGTNDLLTGLIHGAVHGGLASVV